MYNFYTFSVRTPRQVSHSQSKGLAPTSQSPPRADEPKCSHLRRWTWCSALRLDQLLNMETSLCLRVGEPWKENCIYTVWKFVWGRGKQETLECTQEFCYFSNRGLVQFRLLTNQHNQAQKVRRNLICRKSKFKAIRDKGNNSPLGYA